jgi:5-formyltetrahydrofolate cyclo-ligase
MFIASSETAAARMTNPVTQKEALRDWARDQYRSMHPDVVCALSERIVVNLKQVAEFQQARRVMICLSFGNEVNTWPLVEELARDPSRQVCVPRVERDGVMHVHPYPCRLRTLAMGLQQPVAGEPEVVPETLDAVVILGLAFDRQRGYRMGQGKGYFDKFLAGQTFATIGLSFDALMLDEFPVEPHDVPMRLVVTEKQVYPRMTSVEG